MIHKIQSSANDFITLEIKRIKNERCLQIAKGTSILTFNLEETKKLNAITQSIDAEKYTLKDYGTLKKWSELFKVNISAFRGIKSLHIREWVVSSTYAGFGKQWISLPTYKIKEFQGHMISSMQELIVMIEGAK